MDNIYKNEKNFYETKYYNQGEIDVNFFLINKGNSITILNGNKIFLYNADFK